MLKGLVTILAEIIVGVIWCAIMITGTVLMFLVAYGLIGMFVSR